jgi:putative transposase
VRNAGQRKDERALLSNKRLMDYLAEQERFVRPHRSPPHLFRSGATYFVTGKTLHGRPTLQAEQRRQQLIDAFRFACSRAGWGFVAWVVLNNHYHSILQAPTDSSALSRVLASVHRFTSTAWNEEEGLQGRQVWYRYRDTCLTSLGSFYARLNYIHHNPVKHGICADPARYPFSSYSIWVDCVDLEPLAEAYPWDRLELE